jgi:hypothetical protein
MKPGPKQYNIQTTGWLDDASPTGTTNPHPVQLGVGYDTQHRHAAFVAMCDLDATGACAMDGAAHEVCVHGQCPTRAAFGYVDNSTGSVEPYLDLVSMYGWANYMFQTNQGSSYPAVLGAAHPVRCTTSDAKMPLWCQPPTGPMSLQTGIDAPCR